MGKLGFGRSSSLSAYFFHGLCGSKWLIGTNTRIRTFSHGTTLREHAKVGFGQNILTTVCSPRFRVSSCFGLAGPNIRLDNSSSLGVCGSKRWVGPLMIHVRPFLSDGDGFTLEEGRLSSDGKLVPMSKKTISILLKHGFYVRAAPLPYEENLLHEIGNIEEDIMSSYENPPLPMSGLYGHLIKNGSYILSPSAQSPKYPEFTTDLPIYKHLVLVYMVDENYEGRWGIHGMWPSNIVHGRLVSLKNEGSNKWVNQGMQDSIRNMALTDPGFSIRQKFWIPFEGAQLTFWEHECKSHNVHMDSILYYSYFEDISRTSEFYLEGAHSLPVLFEYYRQTLLSLLKKSRLALRLPSSY